MKLLRISLIAVALPLVTRAASVDFAREIRPLLSENCFACHGPDSNKRKAGLKFAYTDRNGDTRKGAIVHEKVNADTLRVKMHKVTESGEIEPNDQEGIELVRRIK